MSDGCNVCGGDKLVKERTDSETRVCARCGAVEGRTWPEQYQAVVAHRGAEAGKLPAHLVMGRDRARRLLAKYGASKGYGGPAPAMNDYPKCPQCGNKVISGACVVCYYLEPEVRR